MTRDDFLRELRIALQGRIPQGQVNEQLQYYENYIIEESRKGKSQEQVLEELGNPRLIAKTIIATYGDGAAYEEQAAEGQQGKKGMSFLKIVLLVLFLVLLVKIGIVLLPVLASIVLVGGIAYLLYRLFFENKK